MSNNVTPVNMESALSSLKITRNPGNGLAPDSSFQQLLQTEIGNKSAPPLAERPVATNKANANQVPQKNDTKNLSNRPANTVTSNSNQLNNTQSQSSTNPATATESETTGKVVASDEQDELDNTIPDPNNAAQMLAMTGVILPAPTPVGEQADIKGNAQDTAAVSSVSTKADIVTPTLNAEITESSTEILPSGKPEIRASEEPKQTLPQALQNDALSMAKGETDQEKLSSSPAFAQQLENASSPAEPTQTKMAPEVESKPDLTQGEVPQIKAARTEAPKADTSAQPQDLRTKTEAANHTAPIEVPATIHKPGTDESAQADVKLQDYPNPAINPATAPAAAPLQASQLAAKSTAYNPEAISAKVGTTAWDRAIGQKVVWMVGSAMQSAELSLNPPELGPLQVVLSISNDQANASFTAAQPEVREALESAMPRLKQMLSDAGVQLSGFSVGAETQQRQQQQHSAQSSNKSGNFTLNGNGDLTTATTASPVTRQENRGLVDTFV